MTSWPLKKKKKKDLRKKPRKILLQQNDYLPYGNGGDKIDGALKYSK